MLRVCAIHKRISSKVASHRAVVRNDVPLRVFFVGLLWATPRDFPVFLRVLVTTNLPHAFLLVNHRGLVRPAERAGRDRVALRILVGLTPPWNVDVVARYADEPFEGRGFVALRCAEGADKVPTNRFCPLRGAR